MDLMELIKLWPILLGVIGLVGGYAVLRSDVKSLKEDIKANNKSLNDQMKANNEALKEDIKNSNQTLYHVDKNINKMTTDSARMNTRLEHLERENDLNREKIDKMLDYQNQQILHLLRKQNIENSRS